VLDGIRVVIATMRLKITRSTERPLNTCSACCVARRKPQGSIAKHAERLRPHTTVESVSYGITTGDTGFIIALTVESAAVVKALAKIMSIARQVRAPLYEEEPH